MRRKRAVRLMMLLPIGLAGLAVFGLVIMGLWNGILPGLFGWRTIGFWQAIGLFILCRLLFGGFGGGGRRRRHHMARRFERMTPEERERVREALRARVGHEPPPPNPA
jgi:hypothetical protein